MRLRTSSKYGRSRSPSMRVGALLPILLFAVLVVAPGPWARSSSPAAPTARAPVGSPGAGALAEAARSLAAGGGPAAGAKWSCASSPGGPSFACGSAASAAVVPPSAPSFNTLPNWTRQAFVPHPREEAAMAYDALDKEIVLFGGTNGSALGDTWIYNGAWVQLHPATSPNGRWGAGMAYDYKDRYLVLYGGAVSGSYVAETWKFVHGAWTQLHPSTSPPALGYMQMAWDSNDSYLVMFSGLTNPGTVYNGTWTFVGGTWTHAITTTGPAGRYESQMAYDNVNGWIVLYSGENATGALSDTWNFSRGHWTLQHPSVTPGTELGGTMTNDSSDGYLVLFGGSAGSGKYPVATWTYGNATWTKMTPATPPPSTLFPTSTFDKALGKVVLFGGYSPTHHARMNTGWTYRATVWGRLSMPTPSDREFAAMTYDEGDHYVLLFGGQYGNILSSVVTNDTWTYAHQKWTRLNPSVAPSPRMAPAITYDAADGYVVLFGGYSPIGPIGYLNDTWTFSAGHWKELTLLIHPLARYFASMAYDAYDGYVVLFGGQAIFAHSLVQDLNDTWTFSGGTWTQLTGLACVCGAPPGRYGGQMTYDAADGYVLLFGGGNASKGALADTWTFSTGVWTNITASAGKAPVGRGFGAMTYDGNDSYVLLYGGAGTSGSFSDSWSFNGGVWTSLNPAVTPGVEAAEGMAFDATDSYVVLLDASGTGATWTY